MMTKSLLKRLYSHLQQLNKQGKQGTPQIWQSEFLLHPVN
jgi:hypothetical protein